MKKNEGQSLDAFSGVISGGEIGTFLIQRNSHTDIVTAAQTEPLAKRPTVILLYLFHGRGGVLGEG